jgi:hypothetical protein
MKSKLFIFILLISFVGFSGCGFIFDSVGNGVDSIKRLFSDHRSGKLDDKEYKWAKIAWQYFDNNYNKKTGLVNGKDGYKIATLWNISDYIIALMAAYEFKIISEHEFDGKLSNLLKFLSNMELCNNILPNRTYNTVNGLMVDYSNKTGETGWSSIDIGRMLIVLEILSHKHSQYDEFIDKIVLRWDLCSAMDINGNLLSSNKIDNKISVFQDGYLGLKEYISRGYQLWGYKVENARKFSKYNKEILYDKILFVDAKDERITKINNALVSSPFFLDLIEFDNNNFGEANEINHVAIDDMYKNQTDNIYQIQKKRYKIDKVFTARNTYQTDSEPFIIYNTLFANGYEWNVIDGQGKYLRKKALISTSAVFCMWALWNDDYTDELMGFMKNSFDPLAGWYEGRYESSSSFENTISCNTNGMILEALLFKANGRLYEHEDITKSYYYQSIINEISNKIQCLDKFRIKQLNN